MEHHPDEIIEAELTWTGEAFEPGVQVAIAADGRIGAVGHGLGVATRHLGSQALLPGFVNAHSHAFQRGLRGRGERFPSGAGSFWTWREEMYALVERLDAAAAYELSRRAFKEMRGCGITTVGEFHYLRHAGRSSDYALDEAVLRAAADARIRIVLLCVLYRTGGFDEPPGLAQERFCSPSLEAFWQQQDRLATKLDAPTQSLGVAAHSVRAVPADELQVFGAEAQRRRQVIHMHLEEQRREIDDCLAACGMRPVALVAERLHLDERFTAVHCTHSEPAELSILGGASANICICPLTEANLGDGIPDAAAMRDYGARVCLGSDCNARLSMTEEARWFEYTQRLVHQRRGVHVDAQGRCARELLRTATLNGARSLGLETGEIRPGACADFLAIDLACPALAGWDPETLLESFLLGTGNEAIAATCVGGQWEERDLPR